MHPKRPRTQASSSRAPREPTPPPQPAPSQGPFPPPVDLSPDPDFLTVVFRDLAQKENFQYLKCRQIQSTRWVDRELLGRLGIERTTRNLFRGLGMEQLYQTHVNTYRVVVLKFLSSLRVVQPRREPIRRVQYRLFNQEEDLTLNAFGRQFGFPEGGYIDGPPDFDPVPVWYALTGEQFQCYQHLHAGDIDQPAIQIWHHSMGWGIFDRQEPNNVRSEELILIGNYLQPSHFDFHILSLPRIMLTHMLKQANKRGITPLSLVV